MDNEQRFVETMRSWLVSLPYDLKVLYEAADDENLDRTAREFAIGAIIYVVDPNDFISSGPDSFLSYSDDCLVLRLALQKVVSQNNEDTEFFKSRFSEFFDTLDEELAVCKEGMGELFDWLAAKVEALPTREYKGKKVAAFLDDDEASELLYEDGLGFRTEYPDEEESLSDRLKKASTILDLLQRRKDEEARKSA